MAYKISKLSSGLYKVQDTKTGQVTAKHTTLLKAKNQVAILTKQDKRKK